MPEQALDNLGVLVTRPAHQAEGLCSRIEQAGGRAIPLPLIEIGEPSDMEAARQQLDGLAENDIVIFVSANAVQRSSLYIGNRWPEGVKTACVGQASARQFTADFARQVDILPATGYDSEALLATKELTAVSGRRILIIKGEGGRALLGETLTDRGADVSYANVYKRCLPEDAGRQLTAIQSQQAIDVVVLTSGEAIHNILSLLDETGRSWLAGRTMLLIHPRLAELARQAGCESEIITSDGAGDDQIMQCLTAWALQRQE